jgi:Tol biopolymer transport system component
MLLVPGGRNPRFSPDGRWIAYWKGRADGSLSPGSTAVFMVEAGGGQPRPIHPEMGAAFYPSWSPASDRLLVRGWKDAGTNEAYDFWSLPIDGGEVKKTGGFPRLRQQGLIGVRQLGAEWPLEWIGPVRSHALFGSTQGDSSNLWEAELTAEGVFTSPARRVTKGPGRQAHPVWAAASDLERIAFSDQIVNYDVWNIAVDAVDGKPHGEMSQLTDAISTEWAPSISDDGRQLVFITSSSGAWGLELKDLEGGHTRRLVSSPSLLASAAISGDGRRVAFTNKTFDLVTVPATGGTLEKVCDHCGTITGISHDGNLILYEPVKDEDVTMFDVKQRKAIKLALRPQPDVVLSGARFSPDEKWIAFHSVEGTGKTTRVWVAPLNRDRPAAQPDWIAVTEGASFAQDPCWSRNGKVLYFMSERDGFRCFWGQPLDPGTKKPAGDPFALRHLHSARQSLRGLASEGYLVGLSSGANRIVFAFPELTANIWLQETARAK